MLSGDDSCRDVYGAVAGFTALGVGGIALALAGGGFLAYEFLRVDSVNKASVSAAVAPAAGGGTFAIKGAW